MFVETNIIKMSKWPRYYGSVFTQFDKLSELGISSSQNYAWI